MKVTIKRNNREEPKEYEVKYVLINIPVDFGQYVPEDFPLIVNGKWIAYVEIETGMIEDWKQGYAGTLVANVIDEGKYYLMDANKKIVAAINGHAPNKLIPPTDGYGDYIELEIYKNGEIANWYEKPSLEEFEENNK
jgi:hypothetical protein